MNKNNEFLWTVYLVGLVIAIACAAGLALTWLLN